MAPLVRLLLVLVAISLAIAYWYVTLPIVLAAGAWGMVQRRDGRLRAAMTAATIAAIPPAPNRTGGPVRWQYGILEVTATDLVVTKVGTTGGVLRPVPFRRLTTIPLTRLLVVEHTAHPQGPNLTLRLKGGGTLGYQGCRDGEAIVRLLEALPPDIRVVENGIRWPQRRAAPCHPAPPAAEPVALRCPVCGAPLERGAPRCRYCHTGLTGTAGVHG